MKERERRLVLLAQQDAICDGSKAEGTFALYVPPSGRPFETTDTFPGYAIKGEIHRGGQGIVYRATQDATGRTVAIKVLRDFAFAGADEESRFRREVRFLARIKHPHIVTIHDSAVVNGRPFFVMDYIDGLALHTFLSIRSWPVERILRLFLQICDAVHAAHVRGIIHRDLKPDNILVDERDEPHILDFGLARLIDEEGSNQTQFQPATQEGQFVGSLPWASPEQAEGRQELIDLRSDVYSLGVILYQVLTGRFPYNVRGNVRDVADRIMKVEPVRPSLIRKDINDEVETIVLKCLSKERERRYQSGGELARDIGRYLGGEPVEARRDSALYVLRKQLRKHRAPLAVIAGFIVLLAVSSVMGWTLYGSAQRATNTARAAEREKTNKLWDAYVAQARAGRFSRKSGQRFDGLRVLAEAAQIRPSMELRNEAIACLALADLRAVTGTESGRIDRTNVATAVDPEQSLWAVGSVNGDISIRDFADNHEVAHLPGDGQRAVGIQFAPGGRYFAAVYRGKDNEALRFCLWDFERREVVLELERRGSFNTEFSPDGASWAIGLEMGVSIFDVQSASERMQIPLDYTTRVISFSPDGSQLALVPNLSKQVDVVDAGTGYIVHTIHAPTIISRVAWRQDGDMLAGAAQSNFVIYLWDLVTGQSKELQGHTATWLSFSSNGEFLLSSGWDSSIKLWNITSGQELCSMPGNLRGRLSLDATDIEQHGFRRPSGELGIIEVNYASECRALRAHAGAYKAPDWIDVRHQRGAGDSAPMLAASCGGDGVRLWDWQQPRELSWLPIGEVDSVLFEPNEGKMITSGPRGIHIWPIRASVGDVQVGPPHEIWNRESGVAAASADGQRLVAISTGSNQAGMTRGAVVLNLDRPDEEVLLLPHDNANYVDISPDGRWVATGTWQSSGVKVWDGNDGAIVAELLIPEGLSPEDQRGESTLVKFSPDGRWLVTSTAQEVVFWEVASWKRWKDIATLHESNMPPRLAFTNDGTMLAINPSPSLVKLYNTESLTELATLEPPERESTRTLCFSPDDAQLLVGSAENLLRIWDLRAIRRQLKEMNLDWDGPDYASASDSASFANVRVHTVLGELDSAADDPATD